MTLITPIGGNEPTPVVLEADKQLGEAAELLSLVIDDIREGNLGGAKLAAEAMRELRKAYQVAVEERMRVEKLRRQEAGIVHDYALDFDSARAEIGRRLARLRDAGGG